MPGLLGSQGNADLTGLLRAGVEGLSNDGEGYDHGVHQHGKAVTDVLRSDVGDPLGSGFRQPNLEDEARPNPCLDRLDPGDVGVRKRGIRVQIHGTGLAVYGGGNESGGRRTLGQTQFDRNGNLPPVGGFGLFTRR